jgi:acylphosphatase
LKELTAVKVIVRGRVQGVFFRASTRKRAADLGLSGTVRNLPERGKVEVQAEGRREQVEALLDFLNTGPPGARVEELITEWSDYTGRYRDFKIVY